MNKESKIQREDIYQSKFVYTTLIKKDGTKVKSHKRTEPDGICSNNLKPRNCKHK